jgi:hypothetical protein
MRKELICQLQAISGQLSAKRKEPSMDPEKKIIVDEDWKSQVEAEKEAARQAEQPAQAAERPANAGGEMPMPPADLGFLIGTLYIQGAMALGLLPNPATKKSELHPKQAKHAIDLLTMLEEKTQGNRTPEESGELEAALHELRLAYVSANKS